MLPDVAGDYELDPHQPDSVEGDVRVVLDLLWYAEVHVDLRLSDEVSCFLNLLRSALRGCDDRHTPLEDVSAGPIDCDDHPLLQKLRRVGGPHDTGHAQLPADDCGVACHPTLVGDYSGRLHHRGDEIGRCHFGDEDVTLADPPQVFHPEHDLHGTRAEPRGGAEPLRDGRFFDDMLNPLLR